MKSYLYLTRRDKKGVKIIAVLNSKVELAGRIASVNDMVLPKEITSDVKQIIYDHRMEWEPWIESVSSFVELKAKLKARGYTNLPGGYTPMVSKPCTMNVQSQKNIKGKTMIQKGG